MERDANIEAFEKKLGHCFNDLSLLEQGLTHSSHAHEQSQSSNHDNPGKDGLVHYERFEFLGDAVLGLVIADLVMEKYPDAREGELSRVRAGLVCCDQLAERANWLGLGDILLLGKGEDATGGRTKASILAAAYEAVIAAVYLDAGFEKARDAILGHFREVTDNVPLLELLGDYKTPLQEKVQARHKTTPRYRVIAEDGPDHDKTFEVEVFLNGRSLARGQGRSKKEAEQDAARRALRLREWSQ